MSMWSLNHVPRSVISSTVKRSIVPPLLLILVILHFSVAISKTSSASAFSIWSPSITDTSSAETNANMPRCTGFNSHFNKLFLSNKYFASRHFQPLRQSRSRVWMWNSNHRGARCYCSYLSLPSRQIVQPRTLHISERNYGIYGFVNSSNNYWRQKSPKQNQLSATAFSWDGGWRGHGNRNNTHSTITDLREKELQIFLRELTELNHGQYVNPRSPRQVSNLIYGNEKSAGPTDKATLLKIIEHNHSIENRYCENVLTEDFDALRRKKQAAHLVLKCRDLMSSTKGRQRSETPGSFTTKTILPYSLNSNSQLNQLSNTKNSGYQAANFSNVASNFTNNCVVNDDNSRESSDACSEAFNETHDSKNGDLAESSPNCSSPSMNSASPYEQMVRALFPTLQNNAEENETNEDNAIFIDPYWMEPLLALTKSSAKALVKQLQATSCPMGYDPSASPYSSVSSNSTSTSKGGKLLSFVRDQKSSFFPDAILLVRVGDFYESYGVDAIALVEHCGLNPMAGKARAGCPWRNVQGTLDGLTNAGFRVAVYEEWNGDEEGGLAEMGEEQGYGGNGKLKTRYLAQVVSSANPTYMHGLVLNDDSGSSLDDTPSIAPLEGLSVATPGRSYVGVIEEKAGYTLVEVSAEERTAVVSERLTSESVSCRLVAYPPADPLFFSPFSADTTDRMKRRLDRLPFLPWRQSSHSVVHVGSLSSPMGRKVRVKMLPSSLVVSPAPGLSDVERAKQTIVSAFLRLEDDSFSRATNNSANCGENGNPLPPKKRERKRVSHEDFVTITPSSIKNDNQLVSKTSATPLHLETATQLGLMMDPSIPSLISSVLPDSAPTSSRRFLRRWLLIPPPPSIADAMSRLVRHLKDESNRSLPSMNAPPLTGKVTSLIRAGQASASVYREILSALDAASEILLPDKIDSKSGGGGSCSLVNPLTQILQHETGINVVSPKNLRTDFLDTMQLIESVVSTQYLEFSLLNSKCKDELNEEVSFFGDVVPQAFFDRNEIVWRGRVKPTALEHAVRVPEAAKRLAEAIALDFWGVEVIEFDKDGKIDLSNAKESKSPVVQDIFNNIIAIKSKPSWVEVPKRSKISNEDKLSSEPDYFHPRDRNGKILRNRYTTRRVEEAVSEYVEACDNARKEVMAVLTKLSWAIVDEGHLPSIAQASYLNLILNTAAHHAANSNARGWNMATIFDDVGKDSAGIFRGLWPYWMDKSNSVSNSFELDGMFLLTAPNMSGKSTLMRSTAAAALLTNCGLCAPVENGSSLRRFDSMFVRGASADVPTEDKSAFGGEMSDISAMVRSCGDRSLVFVDEIGRGTSPKDGTCLAAAILEHMSETGMSGMFATHLHGILNIPYSQAAEKRLRQKRMAITTNSQGQFEWTYLLEDGVCTNSLALVTAEKFGLPPSILKRASELSSYWGDGVDSSSSHGSKTFGMNFDIQHATQILEDIVGEKSSVRIPPSFIPPPSFEGISCVYILQIGNNDDGWRYYVGETDSLSRRLQQHRAKGEEWKSMYAVAIQIKDGKSSARNIESLVIQQMSKSGFCMTSVSDGMTIRSRGKITED